MPIGEDILLDIPHPYTIEGVKHKISEMKHIPPHCQQLTFTGRVLEDELALTDYNISGLELVVRHGSKYIFIL